MNPQIKSWTIHIFGLWPVIVVSLAIYTFLLHPICYRQGRSFYQSKNGPAHDILVLITLFKRGAQWLSGRVLDSRLRGPGSSLTGVTVLCPWARHIYPSLVLVQPRKTHPYITERLLMGRKESNQTNKHCLKAIKGLWQKDLPEPSLLAYGKYGCNWSLRPTRWSLALLDMAVWAFIRNICTAVISTQISYADQMVNQQEYGQFGDKYS